jgi:hypothetical protein
MCRIRDFARTLTILTGLLLLGVGPASCGWVASLEPIYTEKDVVFDPVALGIWYDNGNTHGDTHVYVSRADDKTYDLIVVGNASKNGPREVAVFRTHLVKLKDHLFLDFYPNFRPKPVSGWYNYSLFAAHQIALVQQLSPAPIVTFLDEHYWNEHPLAIRHTQFWGGKDAPILLMVPTKKVQRFLRKAVKRGAFDHGDDDYIWKLTASKATVLHFAAALGDSKKIQQLIGKGAELDARDEKGRTPLHWAAESRQTRAVEQLVGAGADVNASNDDGATPLHMAAHLGNAGLVKTLLDRGANANVKDGSGWMPLHEGIVNVAVVEILLTEGADINAKTKTGLTALHGSANSGFVSVVELLLAKGADVNAKDNKGRTSLDIARERKNAQVIELLKRHGAKLGE